MPVLIRDVEDRQALELAIIENVQRSDLNAIEEAQGYQQLIDEYDYSQADLGNVIGKSRIHVANTLRLLKLPEAVRAMLSAGDLSAGHARALITSEDPVGLARRIVAEGLSVRQAEAFAENAQQAHRQPKPGVARSLDLKTADTRALERQIEERLGLKIDIRHGETGQGEIRIRHKSLEQLEAVCAKLSV